MADQAGPSGSGGAGGSGGATGGDMSLASLMMSGGFAVYPLTWCPHLESLPSDWPETVNVRAPCADCGDCRENWLCLHCNMILCSRYVNSHGLQHSNNTGRIFTVSFIITKAQTVFMTGLSGLAEIEKYPEKLFK